MRRSVWFGVFGALVVASAVRGAGAATCPGDCGNRQSVMINDLITCVSIDLGTAVVTTCPACDVNMDGKVTVNEVIDAVNSALLGCPGAPTPTAGAATPTAAVSPTASMPICGNGIVEADEDCDPPNLDAGKDCAANCTTATRRTATLDPQTSLSDVVMTGGPAFFSPLHVSGTQVLTTGRARDQAVFGPGGKQLFAAGEAPIAVKAADVKFDPVNLNGLACACIRAVAEPSFKIGDTTEGISGIGVAGCGDQGLDNVDFLMEEDHDTDPQSPGNGSSNAANQGLADDPQCNGEEVAAIGGTLDQIGKSIVSDACLEGIDQPCSGVTGTNSQSVAHFAVPSCIGGTTPGAVCSKNSDCPGSTCAGGPNDGMPCTMSTATADCGAGTCTLAVCKSGGQHRVAACNSPRKYTFSGHGDKGSVLLINKTSQTLITNTATNACAPSCSTPNFGPDCTPCTDDDVLIVPPMVVPTTSGTATIRIYDTNDSPGQILGDGGMCGGKPCESSKKGELADCDALKNDPNAPLTGALVTVAPTLDSILKDALVLSTLKGTQ